MTHYPPAKTTAWYADNYPGAKIDPNVGVIHTTEGSTLPGYGGGATAPNYTAVPDFMAKRLVWFAHFPDEQSSRALRNLAGGVETNTSNALQVELVGTCDRRTSDAWGHRPHVYWPDAPDWALEDLAEFIAWANKVHGIPVRGPHDDAAGWMAYPSSYGQGNANRLSFDAWRKFTGWLGHQHVPENSHGDPGSLPWGRIRDMAVEQGPDPEPMTVDVSLVQLAFNRFLDGKAAPTGTGYRKHVRRLQRALNAQYRAGLKTDGLVGMKTVRAWRKHERTEGGGAGKVGVPDWKSIRRLSSPRYTLTPEA